MTVFATLGALTFVSKVALSALPNVHLAGLLIMVYTLVFRVKALFPLYVYVLLEGIVYGFTVWWVPYLYVWTVLWGVTMLLPKKMPRRLCFVVYPVVCGLFGLCFGTLFAPGFALLTHMSRQGMFAWIVNGLPFDAIHGAANLALGFLIVPLSDLLRKLWEQGTSSRS